MDSLTRADLFFTITAFAVVVVGFVATVLLVYIFMIFMEVHSMLKMLRSGAESISQHYGELENKVKSGGISGIAGAIATAVIGAFMTRKSTKK